MVTSARAGGACAVPYRVGDPALYRIARSAPQQRLACSTELSRVHWKSFKELMPLAQ